LNYYPFHLGDYASHTAHFDLLEDLAYRRMLDVYYLRECALPLDPLEVARLVRMRSNIAEIEAVLREFFAQTEGGWTHPRCDAELARMKDKQAKAKASAAVSASVRSANAQRMLSERSADAELPTPTPTPIKTKTPPPPADAVGAFARFWDAWPKHPRKVARPQCERKWRSTGCEAIADRVIAAVEAAKRSADWAKDGGAFIPAPLVWLKQSRWEAATESENAPDVIANAEARRTAEYLEAQERHRQAAIDPEAMARHRAALQGAKERALGLQ